MTNQQTSSAILVAPEPSKKYLIQCGDLPIVLTANNVPGYLFPQNKLQSFNLVFENQVWYTGTDLTQTKISCQLADVPNYIWVSSAASGMIVQTTTDPSQASTWVVSANGNIALYNPDSEETLYMSWNGTNVVLDTTAYTFQYSEPANPFKLGTQYTFAPSDDQNNVWTTQTNGFINLQPAVGNSPNQLFTASSVNLMNDGLVSVANLRAPSGTYTYWEHTDKTYLANASAKSGTKTWGIEDDGDGNVYLTAYNGPSVVGYLEAQGNAAVVAAAQNKTNPKQKWKFTKKTGNVPM